MIPDWIAVIQTDLSDLNFTLNIRQAQYAVIPVNVTLLGYMKIGRWNGSWSSFLSQMGKQPYMF